MAKTKRSCAGYPEQYLCSVQLGRTLSGVCYFGIYKYSLLVMETGHILVIELYLLASILSLCIIIRESIEDCNHEVQFLDL